MLRTKSFTCFLINNFFLLFLQFQCSDKLGLSLELGSFAAGVMISTTDLAQHTLEQVRLHYDICFAITN